MEVAGLVLFILYLWTAEALLTTFWVLQKGPPPERGYPSRPSDRGPERERRPYGSDGPSGPKTIPDRPPYTAFVGNLPFDVAERDIEEFFDPLKVGFCAFCYVLIQISHVTTSVTSIQLANVRLVRDAEGRSRGFGYVEFAVRGDLQAALDGDGTQFRGRAVKIDVAGRGWP